jgi:hypothetical protein
MVHWVTKYDGNRKDIESNINGNWEISKFGSDKDKGSDIDRSPILLSHKNNPVCRISIVQSTNTGTFRIEYVENEDDFNSDTTGESLEMNKQGYTYLLEFVANYTNRFP